MRAARLLGEADIVFHDALVPQGILSLASKAQRIAVGKRCGRHSTAQRFINKRLLDAARRYAVVVRLKGGDPMLFGRAHEEIAFLARHGIEVKIIPGVTAALAASAELGVSLTRRGLSRSVLFATPRAAPEERPSTWAQAAAASDTVVLYMAAGDAQAVRDALLGAGMRPGMPVVVAENVSLFEKNIFFKGQLRELPNLSARCSGGPALLLIGEVFKEHYLEKIGSDPVFRALIASQRA